jgi:primosomal protein N''
MDTADNAVHGVTKFNEKLAEAAKQMTSTYLDKYEEAVVRLADSYEKAAGSTKLDWVERLASTHASLTRDVSTAYATAARELVGS